MATDTPQVGAQQETPTFVLTAEQMPILKGYRAVFQELLGPYAERACRSTIDRHFLRHVNLLSTDFSAL